MPRKRFRVALLLTILLAIAWLAATSRPPPPPDWDEPLRVVIYPHNADGSEAVTRFIADRRLEDFLPIEDFFTEQASRYHVGLQRPFTLALGPEIEQAPVLPPRSRNFFTRLGWGLSVRWWHFRFRDQVNNPDIIVIARYHDRGELPEHMHSIAIAAQRLAVAKLVADDLHSPNNHVIIAHEILHTVGASDLYDPATGLPLYPEGYADPNRTPLHPQHQAEIMAGRIPLTPFRSREAISLHETLIGPATAREINWPINVN